MAPRPNLPEQRNPLLEEDRAPKHEILVERRCLGQTELKVKPGQVGTSNATKPENLGTLDYAHLRVPLPKDLTGSGIFVRGAKNKWPEAYFLMRRSRDGYISATGMFKAAFPFAQTEEETAEKEYIKSLEETSPEEVAGNVWISPKQALDLAEEYGIKLWIAALLDPEPIAHGTGDPAKAISSPPPFEMEDAWEGVGRTPAADKKADSKRSGRTRSMRSESPSASKPKARKIATPRKSRKNKGTLANVDEDVADAVAAVNGDATDVPMTNGDTVKVEVETTTIPDSNGEEVTESTKVSVEVPANHPELSLPDNMEDMLQKAREMVAEAEKMNASAPGAALTTAGKSKRKADEITAAEDEVAAEVAGAVVPAKRARHVETELRKERVRRRALTGIAGVLAIGALVPSIIAAFPWS